MSTTDDDELATIVHEKGSDLVNIIDDKIGSVGFSKLLKEAETNEKLVDIIKFVSFSSKFIPKLSRNQSWIIGISQTLMVL